MKPFNQVAILIPCLNPDEKMLNLIKNLRSNEFEHIIVVNDGSVETFDSYFEEA